MAEPRVPEELLEPLRRVLRWLASLRDGAGRIVCPEHGVEHTGKSAGAIVTACELLRLSPQVGAEFLRDLAVQQGRRLVANLVREGISPCHTFRPGRHDPYNCSNSVIDGGACSDALVTLVRTLSDTLDPADREAFAEAAVLHARSYLRYAVVDKGVPAQRAWGLTGLAQALTLSPEEPMRRAAFRALEELAEVQHADGSFPYHPVAWGAGHAGASDVSAFYQSRVTAFTLFALEALGEDPTAVPYREALVRGVDFTAALFGPDGIKVGLVEAKPWYWGATYEVAAHPFDVYCLARGARLFDRPRAARAARAAFDAWAAHLASTGAPRDHVPGRGRRRSYQCPVFWAGHASWMARALPHLAALSSVAAEDSAPRVEWFADAQLARLEDARVVAWVRGARPACNVHHGSPHGAGLLRCVRKEDGVDLVPRCRLGGHQQGEWSGLAGGIDRVRGWRAGREALRFSLWIAKTHRRAGRPLDAALEPLRTLRRGVLAFAHPRCSSAFDLAPTVELLPDGAALTSRLAHREGTPVAGSALRRTFRVDGEGLLVEDVLESPGAARRVSYRLPESCVEPEREPGAFRYRLR